MPPNSVCITLSREGTDSLLQRAAADPSGRAIYTQAHAFDPALNSVIYTFEQMCLTDFQLAMRKQEHLLSLLDQQQPLVLTGPNTLGYLVIAKDVAPYAMIDEDVQAANDRFIFPLAELLEVHYTHMAPDAPRPFTLNGRFQVAGILSARGYHDPSIPTRLVDSLATLSDSVALHGATALIEDSQLRSFTVAGCDYCALLNEATGPRGLRLTECAFGVNASIADTVNYRINSQLNEGIEGLHVAVGDGRQGYHIDLLMPGVVAAPSQQLIT
ncbi:hypothetical protein [Pseudomonas sp. MH10]|uniref:hypothetical protein n=1 Tax=Pseudomonas sp. MH10 TaxID=3048627 RepID=UPI002AC8EF28|nr:hypothetical protein [Pseudomonas sp. MH10]MEB0042302.1 hypothetical protein [Pseudomonas sp. MH10]WPX65510.1 hypothetical protein RHM59_07670 [Pseudomonas sp. MH10]